MSEEIVDRLKAEGQLIRNTGANSIRSVNIKMDKFEEIFKTISDNIAMQTEMMAKSLDIQIGAFKISKETAEKQEVDKAFKELEEDQKEKETVAEKSESKNQEKSGEGMFSLLGGMGLGKLLMGGALLGGGLFVAYNFAKGFVDEKTGGGWSKFEDGLIEMFQNIDIESISKNLASLTSSLETISGLLLKLVDVFTELLDNPLALFGLGAFSAGRLFGGAGGPRRNGPRGGDGISSRLGRLGPTLLGGVALLALAYGDDAKEFLENQAGLDPDIANVTVDASQYALVGAYTLGKFFGPKGALIGAIAGIGIYGLMSLKKYLDKRATELSEKTIEEYNEALDSALESGDTQSVLDAMVARKKAASAAADLSPEAASDREREIAMRDAELRSAMERAALLEAEGEGLVTRELAIAKSAESFEQGASKVEALTEALQELVNSDLSEDIIKTLEKEEFSSILEQYINEIITKNPDLRADENTIQKAIGSVFRSYQSENSISQEDLNAVFEKYQKLEEAFKNTDDEDFILKAKILNTQASLLKNTPGLADIIKNQGDNEAFKEALENRYQKGTKGFQDFGPASFAILHGKEAVIPEETPAGRFLSQYFNEDWTPKMAESSNLAERVSQASNSFNMPIIVNNSPTISPVVNNVTGGPSVSTTNVIGGGGGNRSMNPYGLTNGIN